MTDRELLELAAKAAGIDGIWNCGFKGRHDGFYRFKANGILGRRWDPRTNEGDLYRLAKALKMKIDFTTGEVMGPEFKGDDGRMYRRIFAMDSEDKVDENIVIAAAEIGKSK